MLIKRKRKVFLLVSVSCVCMTADRLYAAPVARSSKSDTGTVAQTRAAHTTARPRGRGNAQRMMGGNESITVHAGTRTANGVTNTTPGGGLMMAQTAPQTRVGVTRDFIAKQNTNASAPGLLALMPGFVYARTDPYSLTSGHYMVRGLNESEVGYLVDGQNLMDGIYYQVDPMAATPDSENLQSVSIREGSSDITSPAYNAAGAQIEMTTRDPSHKMGGMLESSYGSWNMKKEFARFETGDIGHTGIRGYVSYSYNYSQMWDTPGSFNRHHMDAKFVKSWGDGNSAALNIGYGEYTAIGITGNGAETPTKSEFEQQGTSSLYYSPTYTQQDFKNGSSDYYKLDDLKSTNLMIYAPIKLKLNKELTLHITPTYRDWSFWDTYGESVNSTNSYYGTQPAGKLQIFYPYGNNQTVPAEVVDPQHQHTLQLMANIDWKRGHNILRFGGMYTYLDMHEDANYTEVGPDGLPANGWGRYGLKDANGDTLSPWKIGYRQQVETIYLDDTYSFLHDRLKVTAGFKEVMINRHVTNDLPGISNSLVGANYAEPLPQVAISYNITPHDQIYVNGTTSFKAPDRSEAYLDMWDANLNTPAVQHTAHMKPEYAIGEEIGYRHNGLVHIAASLFNYNITNHDVLSQGYVKGSLVNVPLEVGGETIRGAQLELALRPWHHFSPYLSGAFVHSRMDSNIAVGDTYAPTKGKDSVNTPTFTGAVGLSYDNGSFFANFSLNYVGRRYTTFMNDESIPGYLMADMGLGYRMKTVHVSNKFSLVRPQFQLNFMNVGNNVYYAEASGLAVNAHAIRGVNGSTIQGASPRYNIGGGFAMSGSVTVGF